MKKVIVEVRRGLVEDVKCPPGVRVHVIDYDVHDCEKEAELTSWENTEEDPLLTAAKAVVAKIRKTKFFVKTFLDDTGLLSAIAKEEGEEVNEEQILHTGYANTCLDATREP